MIEGSGSIPLISGSGSGSWRPKNTWIRWIRIRIRIRNTANKTEKLETTIYLDLDPNCLDHTVQMSLSSSSSSISISILLLFFSSSVQGLSSAVPRPFTMNSRHSSSSHRWLLLPPLFFSSTFFSSLLRSFSLFFSSRLSSNCFDFPRLSFLQALLKNKDFFKKHLQ